MAFRMSKRFVGEVEEEERNMVHARGFACGAIWI
jgi:hypothetical protein